ncbi:MAG: hypothetical protein WD007_03120, partial [Nitriliruptoraceae bacterium]
AAMRIASGHYCQQMRLGMINAHTAQESGTMVDMDDQTPTPQHLRTAARACTIMAYAAGLAGIAAGTMLMRDGVLALAIITWVITFAVGACLMGVALLLRAFYGLAATVAWLRNDLRAREAAGMSTSDGDKPTGTVHPVTR